MGLSRIEHITDAARRVLMTREYDLFERYPDGSSLWRASILGLQGTHIHLRQLAQTSGNQFYAIEMGSGKIIRTSFKRGGMDLPASRRTAGQSRAAVA
jgi:hypothetical protein